MQQAGRRARILEPSRRVKRALVTLRELEGLDRLEADLDPERLEDVEEAVEARFPDEVLALLAANDLETLEEAGVSVDSVVEATDRARAEGLMSQFVALGQIDEHTYLCAPREPGEYVGEIFIFDARDESTTPTSVANWLGEHIDRRRAELREGEPAEQTRAEYEAGEVEVAKLELALYRPPERTERRVRHANFGVGTVLAEQGAGESKRFKIAFDDETRTILAEYVEPVDEE